ncbi:caspase family protein [Bradyrhizobium sp. AZCC 2289]|uniref:caspase family protein n=1 Tax=Bradyrhizobium sp. AZCC 2289 TaxID=3117026 RepID=UPI002FF1E3D0
MKIGQICAALTFIVFVTLSSAPTANALNALQIACKNDAEKDDVAVQACTKLLQQSNLSTAFRIAYLLNRGIAYRGLRRCDLGVADFTLVESITSPGGDRVSNFNSRLYRAQLRKDCNDFDTAIADLTALHRDFPQESGALMERGILWDAKKDSAKALADYDGAIKIRPKDPIPYSARGVLRTNLGELDLALADINTAIRLDPKTSLYYMQRGDVWRAKGQLDLALNDLNKAVVMSPKSQNGYLLRGRIYRYRGDLQLALADFDKALALSPGYVAAYAEKGLTYEKSGDVRNAEVQFNNALSSPDRSYYDLRDDALAISRSHLAALDSGFPQPAFPVVPLVAPKPNSLPTKSAVVPNVSAPVAPQGRRVALVIGNATYKNASELANPHKDAEAVAGSLRNIGFDSVTLASDTTREKLVDSLRAFAEEAETADWAMVYYAGHGIELNGQNYLIPVEAKLAADRDVQFEAVPLGQVLAALEGAKKLRIVLLDACRVNPFMQQMRKTEAAAAVALDTRSGEGTGTRSIGRGLARVEVRTGPTLVVFAAKDGQTALDGDGPNSPFAIAMVQRIATPGVEINKIFRLVRDDVMEATAGRQEPYTYGSLPGREDFFFVPAK